MQVTGLAGKEYHTRLLTPADLAALQSLFERSSDYFEIATGRAPAADEAQRAFVGGPPSKSVNQKKTIGIFSAADALVGVLDAIPDWPSDGTWSMGLLLLDPAIRRQGLGGAVLRSYEQWGQERGAQVFRTAIVAHHAPGIAFVERMGYRKENTLPDYDAGGRRATVLFYAKPA
jgi:RimJ/RimL family protein N-acetyltransferase